MTDLTKLTVHLIPKAVDALNAEAARSGDTRTDIVNRAIQLYAAAMENVDTDKRLLFDDIDGRRVVLIARPASDDRELPGTPWWRLWRRR